MASGRRPHFSRLRRSRRGRLGSAAGLLGGGATNRIPATSRANWIVGAHYR
uniref:Uncharacterized protein n=1 Tax=Arundo donax TaxID=35708 RepID=A0A0A9GLK7_ARUDO